MIPSRDAQQRASFVALNLIKALQQQNDVAVAVSRAYLPHRQPDLSEVDVNDHEDTIVIEFLDKVLQ